MADRDCLKHESSKFQVKQKLDVSEAKIVELQLSLEQMTQLSKDEIDQLVSLKYEAETWLAALEAELASITNEGQSNSSNADDNLDRIQEIGGTIEQYKTWSDRMKSKNDSELCHYNLMHNARFSLNLSDDRSNRKALKDGTEETL